MKKEDAEEFTQSLGQIVGGSWRQIALAKRLGVPQALGVSVEDWVSKRLGGYVKLTVDDRRKAVEELAAEGHSTREIAEVIGVGNATVHRDLHPVSNETPESGNQAKSVSNETPVDTVAALAASDKIRTTAKATETRKANEEKRKADLYRPVNVAVPTELVLGDFRTLSPQMIADNSVELVFTDPPYDEDSVVLYEDAAREAARILKPGGSFIAYSGQHCLPGVLAGVSKHLRYWWTCAGIHEGGNQMLEKLGIRCGWKPLVWFVKDTRGHVQKVMLDIVRGDREKQVHEWQQALSEARYFIESLTSPTGFVVDFFVGGGTTLLAAKQLGRQRVGFERDVTAVERAVARLKEAA